MSEDHRLSNRAFNVGNIDIVLIFFNKLLTLCNNELFTVETRTIFLFVIHKKLWWFLNNQVSQHGWCHYHKSVIILDRFHSSSSWTKGLCDDFEFEFSFEDYFSPEHIEGLLLKRKPNFSRQISTFPFEVQLPGSVKAIYCQSSFLWQKYQKVRPFTNTFSL